MDRDPITLALARNLQSILDAGEIDMATMNRVCGLSPTGVNDILTEKSRSVKADTIVKIARGLNIPIHDLIGDPDEDRRRAELVAHYEALPEQDRDRLLQTARAWHRELGRA